MLQVVPHVSRLPFLPIRVRGIFSYLLAINPTATLYLTLSLTSLSVREIRAMIAPLDPGHVGKDLLNRRRAQG